MDDDDDEEEAFPYTDIASICIPATTCTQKIFANREKIFSIPNNEPKQSYPSIITQTSFAARKTVDEAISMIGEICKKKPISSKYYLRETESLGTNHFNYNKMKGIDMLVYGSPESNHLQLANLTAKHLKIHLLDPLTLINQEIYRKTLIGKWIYGNIKLGKKIPIDIINELLLIELSLEKYNSRAVVISGFPILINYEMNSTHLPLTPEHLIEIDLPLKLYDDHVIEDDENNDDDDEIQNYRDFLKSYIDIKNNVLSVGIDNCEENINWITAQNILYQEISNTRFILPKSQNYISESCTNQLDLILERPNRPEIFIYLHGTKPCDYIVNSKQFIQHNNFIAIKPIIDRLMMYFDKANVIKIDESFPIEIKKKMLYKTLDLFYHKIFYHPIRIFPNGKIPENLQQIFQNKSIDKILNIISDLNCIGPNYPWYINHIRYYCPIELMKGKLINGKIEYAICFEGRILLFATKPNVAIFYQEPEKYLFITEPCRLAILGPSKCGKSIITEIFSIIYNCEKFNCKKFIAQNFIDYPEFDDIYIREAYEYALETAQLIGNNKKEYYENIKINKLDELKGNVINLLLSIINHLNLTDTLANDELDYLLNDEIYQHTFLPNECFEIYIEPKLNDGLTQLLLHDYLYNIYGNILIENNYLNKAFVKRANGIDYCRNINSNKGYQLYGQWILDGPPLDLNFWEYLDLHNQLPDIVIIFDILSIEKFINLYDEYYNKNFTDIKKLTMEFTSHTDSIDEIINKMLNYKIPHYKYKDNNVRKYSKFLAELKYNEWNKLKENLNILENYLNEKNITIIYIDITNKSPYESISYSITQYFRLFEGNIRKVDFKNYINEKYNTNINNNNDLMKMMKNYLLGATRDYCPIDYYKLNTLRIASPEYCIEYHNRWHFFCSQECENEFYNLPSKYFYNNKMPVVPPLLIFVIGPNHVAKNIFCQQLADKLFSKFIVCIQELDNMLLENNDNIDNKLTDEYIKQFRKKSLIISGFPYKLNHMKYILEKNILPDAVFILEDMKQHFKSFLTRDNKNIIITSTKQMNKFSTEMQQKYTEKKVLDIDTNRDIKNFMDNEYIPLINQSIEIADIFNNLNIPIYKVPYEKQILCNHINSYAKKINRNCKRSALFQNIHQISLELADKLLNSGYSRYSRFKLSCPVCIDDLICFNSYNGMKKKNQIYPCLIRDCIYFLNSKEHLLRFLYDPLKYINTCNPYQLKNPLIIGCMGPEFSGCSSLCQRIANQYDMKIYRPNDFINIIKYELKNSKLYHLLSLNNWKLNDNIFIECINTFRNIKPNGIIIDNYNLTPQLLTNAALKSIDIRIVFIIDIPFKCIMDRYRLTNNYDNIYELALKYENYLNLIKLIENANEICLFNIKKIKTTLNTWQLWNDASKAIDRTCRNYVGYHIKLRKNLPASLKYLNVFYTEVLHKLDNCELYCPMCLKIGNLIRYRYDFINVGLNFYSNSFQNELLEPYGYLKEWLYNVYKIPKPFSYNTERKPIFTDNYFSGNFSQYGKYIYWFCDNHMIEFILNSSLYCPVNINNMPEYIPIPVDNYYHHNISINGYCIIEYDLNIKDIIELKSNIDINPKLYHINAKKIHNLMKLGDRNLSVYYRGEVYLFCSNKCILKFLMKPQYYYNLNIYIPNIDNMDDYDEKEMELNLGDLDPKLIIDALKALSKERPKHYALTTTGSASIFLGFFLKIRNSHGINDLTYWSNKLNSYRFECKLLEKKITIYKQRGNPFILKHGKQDRTELTDNDIDNNNDNDILQLKCRCCNEPNSISYY